MLGELLQGGMDVLRCTESSSLGAEVDCPVVLILEKGASVVLGVPIAADEQHVANFRQRREVGKDHALQHAAVFGLHAYRHAARVTQCAPGKTRIGE